MNEFIEITEKIKKGKLISPPEHLLGSIMQKLSERNSDNILNILFYLRKLHGYTFLQERNAPRILTSKECAFYFFITGLYYLIVGIVLALVLKSTDSSFVSIFYSLKLQPHLVIGMAILFISLGVLLVSEVKAGIKAAKYGTILYIIFVVINGLLMGGYLHIFFAKILFFGFVFMSVIIGVILSYAVRKVELRMTQIA